MSRFSTDNWRRGFSTHFYRLKAHKSVTLIKASSDDAVRYLVSTGIPGSVHLIFVKSHEVATVIIVSI
jgi:hypothetical protein